MSYGGESQEIDMLIQHFLSAYHFICQMLPYMDILLGLADRIDYEHLKLGKIFEYLL